MIAYTLKKQNYNHIKSGKFGIREKEKGKNMENKARREERKLKGKPERKGKRERPVLRQSTGGKKISRGNLKQISICVKG